MSRSSLTKLTRATHRSLQASRPMPTTTPRLVAPSAYIPRSSQSPVRTARYLSSTSYHGKGIMPETDNPNPKQPAETVVNMTAAQLTDAEYHQIADEYLETVLAKLEELQETREDLDVEFSDGVLTVTLPPAGTYVLNKQPPNKQLWLSSPRSGPKRYDWVVLGDGQNDKEGTAVGDWIYLRERTSLNKLLRDELGVELGQATSQS
ncbi:hypothetical protein VTK73DRAFT_1901 [Phialemonium thermophilum]|uniref:ferroxidase n=1 Tax=Phialemonium thermophilum TaxID=223376 RepID=A0ABR3Y3E6_9PEZI